MAIVAEPMGVQTIPLSECQAVKVVPLRSRRIHSGMGTPARVVWLLVPPVKGRRWKETPCPGVARTAAWVEFALRVSRIITPALAQELVLVRLDTRAVITPFPLSGW